MSRLTPRSFFSLAVKTGFPFFLTTFLVTVFVSPLPGPTVVALAAVAVVSPCWFKCVNVELPDGSPAVVLSAPPEPDGSGVLALELGRPR